MMRWFAPMVVAVMFAAPGVQAAGPLGFPLGDKSRIHTNLELGVAYDTNPGRYDDPSTNLADGKLQIRPGIDVDVPGTNFRLGFISQLTIDQFLQHDQPAGGGSKTTVGGNAALALGAGSPGSLLGFELSSSFVRTPTFTPLKKSGPLDQARPTLPSGSFELRAKSWYVANSARLVVRPGGGALEFRLGYRNSIQQYDERENISDLPDSQLHGATLEAKLKFLPKTAALFAADFSFFSSTIKERGFDPTAQDRVQRANPYNVEVGLQGQLTPRLRSTLRLGFGDALVWAEDDGFFGNEDALDSVRTLVARADFHYAFGVGREIFAGYRRAVVPTIVARAFVSDTFDFGARILVVDRLSFNASGQYELRKFTQPGRTARVSSADARLTYNFFPFLSSSAVYQLLRQNGDELTNNNRVLEDYTRHLAMLVIGLHY